MENILEVKNLAVDFTTKTKRTSILKDINFSVKQGETVAIVGESGCGKSLTSLSIMDLLPNGGEISNGEVRFKDENLVEKTKKEMSNIRGNEISMIFQEPMTSLNPVQKVGKQIAESIRLHQNIHKKEAWRKAQEMIELVGIPSPEKRAFDYPFEMSGGMLQRVMIAMALSCNPEVLIADEPTTALDVTTQAQILKLIERLKQEFNMSVIFITHDFGVVSQIADRVLVMYAGKVVESSDVGELIQEPKHPYTKGLIHSIPKLNEQRDMLPTIKGTVPNPDMITQGCVFADRCSLAKQICFEKTPFLTNHENYQVSCWAHEEGWENMKEVTSNAR